jgi:cell wall-associated NlpC family hydrolase
VTESPHEALERILASYDPRIHYCRVELSGSEVEGYRLTGAVLDEDTLVDLVSQMAAALPGFKVDVGEVRVLAAQATRAAVGVNLTGLFAQPSWLAEQISQLLNGWPLDVLMTDGMWRFVRQADGYLGWAYGPYLAEPIGCAYTHLVCRPEVTVLAEPAADAAPVTRLPGGTAVTVDATEMKVWQHVSLVGGMAGWMPGPALRAFAALPEGEAARRAQIMADATMFIGVPYLWGGCSAWGIDCSGFAQLLYRLAGVTIPRDADMQYAASKAVEYPYQAGDLLFFSETGDVRRITHVAISRGGWDIIHSSRRINGVYEDNIQAVGGLRETFVGGGTFVR